MEKDQVVIYIGPGKDYDPRTLTVSKQEAKDLVATRLWELKKKKKPAATTTATAS